MGDKTEIEWTEATWNPVTGCTKVSQGCKHCYAERDWSRLVHLPAETLGVSPRTVAREINDGAITVVQVRGSVRIDPADAQAYISRQKVRREKPWPSTSAASAGTPAGRTS